MLRKKNIETKSFTCLPNTQMKEQQNTTALHIKKPFKPKVMKHNYISYSLKLT